MLYDFVAKHRDEIIGRTREKARSRSVPFATETVLARGVPIFLDQFSSRLRQSEEPTVSEIGATAALEGADLLAAGLTIGQVVHGYGDICQAVTELAIELKVSITAANFKMLNMCLDVAIAEAVTEYARRREKEVADRGVEQLGFLVHEVRNLMNTVTLAFEAIRSGRVGVDGSTGQLITSTIADMSSLVTRSLAEVRLESGPPREDRTLLSRILEETEIAAIMQAKKRNIVLSIEPTPAAVEVAGDAQIIASIVTNLVQNACKFTREHGRVRLSTRVTGDRISIDVADECGGLPAGKAEDLFKPFEQKSADRSGLGLGLAISLKGAHAIGGELSVRDISGVGCVFSVELRRWVAAAS